MKQSLINFIVRQASGPIIKWVSPVIRFGVLWALAQLTKLDPAVAANFDATKIIACIWGVVEVLVHQIAMAAHMDKATDLKVQAYLKQDFPLIPVKRAAPVQP